jgi:hypothetical protein
MTEKSTLRLSIDIEIDSDKASELPAYFNEHMRYPWAGIGVARYELTHYLCDVVEERWAHLDAKVVSSTHTELSTEKSGLQKEGQK